MSLGGFTARVRITETRIDGGVDEGGKPYRCANMKMEGTLLELHYGDLKGRIPKEKKTSISVEIEFTESQHIHDRASDEDKEYIGVIHLNDYRSDEKADPVLVGTVRITLSLDMFNQLALMEGRNITFDAIHDLIASPTIDQRADSIIAFVRRVYFETRSEVEPAPEQKSGWW